MVARTDADENVEINLPSSCCKRRRKCIGNRTIENNESGNEIR